MQGSNGRHNRGITGVSSTWCLSWSSMTPEQLDTAHEYWDNWWGEAKTRSRWSEPDSAVTAFIPVLRARGAKQVMDVGTGIGRHALAYARNGFDVTATD